MDVAGPDLALLTGPATARWTDIAHELNLRLIPVHDAGWLAEVQLPEDGALLLRPDAVVAWHSTSTVTLQDAVERVLHPARSRSSTILEQRL